MSLKLAATLAVFACCQNVFSTPVDELFEKRAASSQCNSDNVLRAMQHRTPDSYSFCSSYISQPAATTTEIITSTSTYTHTSLISATVHPLYFCNYQPYASTETPVTYKSPATPSPVPGCPCYYPLKDNTAGCPTFFKRDISARASSSPTTVSKTTATTTSAPRMTTATTTTTGTVPDYLATVPPSRISSGCSCLSPPYATTVTTYGYTEVDVEGPPCTYYTTATTGVYPAFCQSAALVNSPAIATGVANITTVKSFNSKSKLDCCASCSSVLNCVWWKFNFGHPYANGSGDPFAPGTCQYAFFTGYDAKSVNDYNNLAVCPNGQVNLIPNQYNYGSVTRDRQGYEAPGYNQGPCGDPLGAFESSQDQYPSQLSNNQC